MSRPPLELLVAPGTGERIAPLAHRLMRWCDPRAADRALPRPAARLASSWRAPSLEAALGEGEPPLALWVSGGGEVKAAAALLGRCQVVLTDQPELIARLGEAALLVPGPGLDPRVHRPLTPFVRSRWRSRLGFPADFVVDARAGSDAVPERLVPTALALAGAAVVDTRWLDLALALGTPVVTDAASARRAGATSGTEVLVADPGEAGSVAADVAGDLPRAAALGCAGRRLCERRHDLGGAAAELVRRLQVSVPLRSAEALVQQRLDEMWAPPDAQVAVRARAAVAAFAGPNLSPSSGA